jgi:hypothetical protein
MAGKNQFGRSKTKQMPYGAVFLLVCSLFRLSGEFTLLTNWSKRSAESESDCGTEEESAGVEADDDVDFRGGSFGQGLDEDVAEEGVEEELEMDGVEEEGEDVEEEDALGSTVRTSAEKRTK